MSDKAEKRFTFAMLIIGLAGFVVSFPLWLLGAINDRAMLGLTLVLSWMALWYSAFLAWQTFQHAMKAENPSAPSDPPTTQP